MTGPGGEGAVSECSRRRRFLWKASPWGFILAVVTVVSLGHIPGQVLADDCPLRISAEINEWLVLYDAAPEPWWFFPLVLSSVEEVGMVGGGQRVRICETAVVSTWQRRSLWVRIDGEPGEELVDPVRMRTQGWVRAGPTDLNSFLARQRSRR